MNELEKIVTDVSEKLGVRLGFREESPAEKNEAGSSGARSDGKHTYFRFSFAGETYTGVLDGASKAEKNYAALLPAYLASFAEKNAVSQGEYLKKMLLGEYSQTDAYKYAVKFGVKEIPCFVLAIRFTKAYPETEALLKQYADAKEDCVVKFDDKNFAFVKAAEPSEEYSSPAEYAGFLAGFLTEELGARVCIGAGSVTGGFHDLQLSYSRAVTALRYAEVFSGGEGVHSYKEYMLVKLLEEVPKSRLDEFLSDITEEQIREVFDDEEMLLTAEKFLSTSLNVSETSRALYMHRNTLLYRLDKIEKATGLNIRLFPDAVTFRILIIIYKLSKK